MARTCIQFGLTPTEYYTTGFEEIQALYYEIEPKTDLTGLI